MERVSGVYPMRHGVDLAFTWVIARKRNYDNVVIIDLANKFFPFYAVCARINFDVSAWSFYDLLVRL